MAAAWLNPAHADTMSFTGDLRGNASFLSCGIRRTLEATNRDGNFAHWAAVVSRLHMSAVTTLQATFLATTCLLGANWDTRSRQCFDVLPSGGTLTAGNYQIVLAVLENPSFAPNLDAGIRKWSELAQAVLGFTLGLLLIPMAVLFAYFVRLRPKWRLVTVKVPSDPRTQAVRNKILEAIRSNKYFENKEAGIGVYSPRRWEKWAFGAADVLVSAEDLAVIRVTCSDEFSWVIRQIFPESAVGRYDGHQPVWPIVKAAFRVSAVLVAFLVVGCAVVYLVVA